MLRPMQVTYRFRLRDKCSAELDRQARAVNIVWNFCNETQQRAAQHGRKWLTSIDLMRLTAGAGKLLDIHSHTVQKICQSYDRSRRFRKKPWLRWRGQGSLGWVPFNTGHVLFDGRKFRFRGIAYEPMHLRDIAADAQIGSGSFSRDSRGRWYLNAPVEIVAADLGPAPMVGIDLGLKSIITTSDGDKIEAPRFYRKSEAALAAAQRAKSTKRMLAIHRSVANRRRDFAHKLSNQLSKKYGLIVVGDVSPSKLAQTRMAKSIYDAGWSGLKRMLLYKSIRNGGVCLEVSEHMTTQTCSSCGALPPERPLGIAGLRIREWDCRICGAVHDRDVNAAKNILARGLASLAEGAPSQEMGSSQKQQITCSAPGTRTPDPRQPSGRAAPTSSETAE